jgi:hypothetical protein
MNLTDFEPLCLTLLGLTFNFFHLPLSLISVLFVRNPSSTSCSTGFACIVFQQSDSLFFFSSSSFFGSACGHFSIASFIFGLSASSRHHNRLRSKFVFVHVFHLLLLLLLFLTLLYSPSNPKRTRPSPVLLFHPILYLVLCFTLSTF